MLLEVHDSSTSVITSYPVIEILEITERGLDGKSAYQIAVNNGFVGTELEWLSSLQGNPGSDGAGSSFSEEFIVTNALEDNFTLMYVPTTNSLRGFLNGLRERKGQFTVVGNTVNFPFLDLAAGDELTFDYRF